MIDFIQFMTFSSLEFFALMMSLLVVYNLNIRYYKKEILITTLSLTLLSYLLTMAGVHKIIPLPILEIPILVVILKMVFGQTWKRSLILSIAGFVFVGLLEAAIILMFAHLSYLNFNEIEDAFTFKGYVVQSISAIVLTTIAIYIKTFNGGFGFTFRKEKFKTFIFTTMGTALLIFITSYAFIITKTFSYFLVFFITILLSTVILLYFSHQRDRYEYSE